MEEMEAPEGTGGRKRRKKEKEEEGAESLQIQEKELGW